jgi:hypothetical protein
MPEQVVLVTGALTGIGRASLAADAESSRADQKQGDQKHEIKLPGPDHPISIERNPARVVPPTLKCEPGTIRGRLRDRAWAI